MIEKALTREGRKRRRRNRERLLAVSCTVMIGAALCGRLALPSSPVPNEAATSQTAASERLRLAAAPTEDRGWLFDPVPVLGSGATTLRLSRAAPAPSEPVQPPAEERLADQREESALQTLAAVAEPVLITVPLPMRRPDGLTPSPRETVRLAQRSQTPRVASAGRVDAQAEQSFFETVFGANKPEAPALAYAPLDSGAVESGPRRLTGPSVRAEGTTAVYNILARTVTLPSGERLEAHSGLGPAMDNPNFVHLRMRGSTPPGTYDLTERERLFHGVRAIRLNPVGGSAAIHGRDGILAHTYMLGPKGASNGCVSFRDYNRFLQAYLRGEVRRLVVIAGSGSDRLPSVAERVFKRFAGAD